jgi:hypothetical protein
MWFESGNQISPYPRGQFGLRPKVDAEPDGWVGAEGPAISPALWPRDPIFGMPMNHGITLRLPEDYQRRGPEFPGVSFFQSLSPDVWYEVPAVKRPRENDQRIQLRPDLTGGWGVLLWLTESELTGPRITQPGFEVESDAPGTGHGYQPEVASALWLIERVGDPNAGRAPKRNEPSNPSRLSDYLDPDANPGLTFESELGVLSHLGGTAFPTQWLPDGLSPYYIEIEEFATLNFGAGGNAQIDLENSVYDWACS